VFLFVFFDMEPCFCGNFVLPHAFFAISLSKCFCICRHKLN
jgi:hypothetical protein